MKNVYYIIVCFFLPLIFSCESFEKEGHDHDDHDHGDEPVGSIDLENCDEAINSDVPDFYKNYFNCVSISVTEGVVLLSTTGFPPYKSMYYPENYENYTDFVSQGNGYYQNPNSILEQSYAISILDSPVSRGLSINSDMVDGVLNTNSYEYGMGAQGIALNGVILFNPLAGPGDDIENEKYSFDSYSGHPEMNGVYHYHTSSKGPLEVLAYNGFIQTSIIGSAEIELYGIMCDGTLVLGCTELDGSAPSSSDFDSQNGHVHDISNGVNIFFTNRYHTHICTDTYTDHKFTPEIQYYEGCQ